MAVIDSFTNNQVGFEPVIYGGGNSRIGQSFSVGSGALLRYAQFYLKKNGSPTGNITAKLYSHSGTFGSSSVPDSLLETSSTSYDATLLTGSLQWIEFEFSNYSLSPSTNYCIELNFSGGSVPNWVMVASNSAGGHSGNAFSYDGAYSAQSYDACFILKTPPPYITGLSSITGISTIKL